MGSGAMPMRRPLDAKRLPQRIILQDGAPHQDGTEYAHGICSRNMLAQYADD
jgi:hypothetical protein